MSEIIRGQGGHRWAIAVVLLASVVPSPASAQQGGIYLTSPISLEATRESRIIVNNQSLDDDVLLVLPPTVSAIRVSARGEVALSYQPEVELFAKHRDLSSLNHLAELLFSHASSPRVTVSAGDSFISTSDPSRRVVDSVLLLPRDRLTQNAANLQLTRRFRRATSLSVSLDNVVTLLENPLDSATRLTNSVTSAANLSLSHTVARKNLWSVTYSFLDARPLREVAPVEANPFVSPSVPAQQAHSVALGYMYQGETLSLRAAGGLIAGIGNGVLVQGNTYTGSAEIAQRVGKSATLSVTGQRSLSYFSSFGVSATQPAIGSSGLVPAAMYESVILRLSGDLSRHISARAEGSLQRTHSSQDVQNPTALDVQSRFARVRFDYWLGRNFAFFGVAELYRQSFNAFVGVPLDWQRYGVGVEVATTSKPSPLAQRQKETSLRERRYRRGDHPDGDQEPAPDRSTGEAR